MRKKLSIPLGLAIFFIIVPLVNAQVGDQNGIPPTNAFSSFILDGIEYLAGSYDSALEFVAGDNIILDLNNVTGVLMINSTGSISSIHQIGNVTNSGCAVNEILQVNSSGIFDCATAGAGGSGEINTASNLIPGIGMFAQKNLLDLEFKGLVGEGINISSNSTSVILNVTAGGGSGETNTASNLNDANAYGIFGQKNGVDLEFLSLVNGSGISMTSNGTNIMINSTSTRDQIFWNGNNFGYNDLAIHFAMDGTKGSFSTTTGGTIVSKPLYLDYFEIAFNFQSIPDGTWAFRIVDPRTFTALQTPDCSIDMSTVTAGDIVRCEIDTYVYPGSQIMMDGEMNPAGTSGSATVSTILEYYAVNDAMDFPGWEFQDDNLGNHTATQALDMNANSIQNVSYIETDGAPVSGTGSFRLANGDALGWRNNGATSDHQIGFGSTDQFVINFNLATEYYFNATDFEIGTNKIKGTMGCTDNDLLDYNSATDRWECLDPTTLGGSSFFQTMIWNGDPTLVVSKGATVYLGFGSASSATENNVRIPMGEAGTASRLECEVSASGTSANTQILVRKNNNNTILVVNYAAGVTGIQQDFTNSFTFNQQDRIDIRVINNSAGGGAKDITIQHCSFLVTYD